MGNIDTIKAITTNIEAILTSAPLSWDLEDLSDNPKAETRNVCFVKYLSERFEDVFNQRPSYIEAEFAIVVVANKKTKALSRAAQQEAIHLLRNVFTVNALNIGDLSESKLVSMAKNLGGDTELEGLPASAIAYRLVVRYRET